MGKSVYVFQIRGVLCTRARDTHKLSEYCNTVASHNFFDSESASSECIPDARVAKPRWLYDALRTAHHLVHRVGPSTSPRLSLPGTQFTDGLIAFYDFNFFIYSVWCDCVYTQFIEGVTIYRVARPSTAVTGLSLLCTNVSASCASSKFSLSHV